MRIRPPHSSEVSPAMSVPPSAKPIANGTANPASTHQTNVRLTKLTTGSASRSGA
jgi:hypothetical protein